MKGVIKMLNQKMVSVELQRGDLCDIALALTLISQATPDAKKWKVLHDKIKNVLHDFDKENV